MLQKIQATLADLDGALLERTDVTRGIMTALLAKRHVFLLGPPGTAKSMTVDSLQERVTGTKRFKVLMTRFTTPEEVIGPVRVSVLKQDRFERAVDGYLPDAHLAFLDEVFKANSAILNALLTLLNEREYRNGTVMHKAPLITCVGASNELPQGEDLGALYDRFLLRFYVPALTEDASFAKLLTMTTPAPTATVTLAELESAQRDVANVTLDASVVQDLIRLRAELSLAGIGASDRRWRESVSLLKAEAWLCGRSRVTSADICALANVLWSDPAERSKVAQRVVGFAVPALAKALELLDLATEQHKAVTTAKVESVRFESASKYKSLRNEFDTLRRQDNGSPRFAAIATKFDSMTREVSRAVIGG